MRTFRTSTRAQTIGLALWAAAVAGIGVAAAAAPASHHEKTALVTTATTVPTTTTAHPVTSVVPTSAAPDAAATESPATAAAPTMTNVGASTSAATSAPSEETAAAPTVDTTPAPTPNQAQPTPGRYAATITGSATLNGSPQGVPGSGALVIEQVNASDQHQTTPSGPADADMILRYNQTGADLASLKLSVSSITKTFLPAAGSSYLRFDSPVGTTWSWTVNSTDGKTRVVYTAGVTRDDVAQIEGRAVPVSVIDATLTITGDVSGTAHVTTWLAKAERLPVIQRFVINATASVFGFSANFVSDTTTTLQRMSPS